MRAIAMIWWPGCGLWPPSTLTLLLIWVVSFVSLRLMVFPLGPELPMKPSGSFSATKQRRAKEAKVFRLPSKVSESFSATAKRKPNFVCHHEAIVASPFEVSRLLI